MMNDELSDRKHSSFSPMLLGYNTNGLANVDLCDAVELLADIGYRGIGLTIDHGKLSPFDEGLNEQFAGLKKLLTRRGFRSVIETGARHLLDSRVRHEPTLLSDDRRTRIEFYKHAVLCAAELGSDCVSLWSGGIREPITRQEAFQRLIDGLREVLDFAAEHGVLIGFEPEPGMLIDSMRAFEELLGVIDAPNLRLTLDIGHLHCQGETPPADYIRRWAPRLVNVHIEDMRRGVHEHLMFGEGEIDFPPIFQALADSGYTGGVYVELSHHGGEGPAAARRAFDFLSALGQEPNQRR